MLACTMDTLTYQRCDQPVGSSALAVGRIASSADSHPQGRYPWMLRHPLARHLADHHHAAATCHLSAPSPCQSSCSLGPPQTTVPLCVSVTQRRNATFRTARQRDVDNRRHTQCRRGGACDCHARRRNASMVQCWNRDTCNQIVRTII